MSTSLSPILQYSDGVLLLRSTTFSVLILLRETQKEDVVSSEGTVGRNRGPLLLKNRDRLGNRGHPGFSEVRLRNRSSSESPTRRTNPVNL